MREMIVKCRDNRRVKLSAALDAQLVHRRLDRHCPPVRPVRSQRVKRIGDMDQSRAEGDLRTGQAVRIARASPMLMVMQDVSVNWRKADVTK
jgi:hypothetical protein